MNIAWWHRLSAPTGRKELWNKKHGTRGFNVQFISRADGTVIWVSDPLPGKVHDARAFKGTGAEKIVKKSAGGIADRGYQGTGMTTPVKKQKKRKMSKYVKRENTRLASLRAPVESRSLFQELEAAPHRLPAAVQHLPRFVRRGEDAVLLLYQVEF